MSVLEPAVAARTPVSMAADVTPGPAGAGAARQRRAGWVEFLADPLERAGSSFAQQFATMLLAAGAGGILASQEWALAADSAGFAAVMSLALSYGSVLARIRPLAAGWDLVIRLVRTFASSVVGTLTAKAAVHTLTGANWQAAVAVAVPVTLAALLKGVPALGVEQTFGASFIPKSWGS